MGQNKQPMISNICSTIRKRHVFASFLKTTRHKYRLSQEKLCATLKLKSRLFHNLDIITLSRWERGVNIPSLAKQVEVVELYSQELVDIYSQDHHFVDESLNLLALSNLKKSSSAHPYYHGGHDNYKIETINADNPRFKHILKMIHNYEDNPQLEKYYLTALLQRIYSLKIVIATVFDNQVVGHCLYLESNRNKVLQLLNCKTASLDLCDEAADSMLVLSSNGASVSIENCLMSVYINNFASNKQLKYLCWYISDTSLLKKLARMKLLPFKVKPWSAEKRYTSVSSFLIDRSQVMANRFLLKLAVISPSRRAQFFAAQS
ncbi:helix-turn-helix domain-containing protein [Shewanella sp. YLB-07]|uniref:helix-turn-helix domain-containing protein n=1 Tax=Shewanella sp. YLB-07 TaxID=2601268 RepID=UPI00128AFE26|nr:hypothetical protein [Shewanella sp. YLB-07]MPY24394.1 hypothetical protein [Shewanella sp. YLB-07]